MFVRICLSFALATVTPAWPQVSASTAGGAANESQMQMPPPVSNQAYSMELGSEARSNYLHMALVLNTAYDDNVLPETGTAPISDVSYTLSPTITLDQTTSRLHQTFAYRPGFTFYQHNSYLNEVDQNLALDFQYRLGPHVTASVTDTLRKSSTAFNQLYALSGGAISGSAQSSLVPVFAPTADQLTNSTNVALSYQFSRDSMIGASGTFTILHYPNPSEVQGLYDSNSRGGAGFFSHRLSRAQYIGVTYQYSTILSTLPSSQSKAQAQTDSETLTHTVFLFYSLYLSPNLSISVSSGPEYFDVSQYPFPPIRSWTPAAIVSMGWQGRHTSFAASYSHIVSGGGGLQGAFTSNSVSASARWQIERTWTVGSAAIYSTNKNVSQFESQSNPGGHTISGAVTVQHPISDHLNMEFGYMRLSQSYANIAAVSSAPNANREYVSISYQFARPLGR
jgi:hypothetical protein